MLAALSLIACDKSPAPTASKSPAPIAPAIHRAQRTTSGDATLDLATSIDRTDLSVADRLTITFACTTRLAATLTLPDIGEKLGDFTVASAAKFERADSSGNRVTTLTLVLEPFLSGEKSIPPLTFEATDTGRTLKLKTEPIVARVTSVADDKANAATPLEAAKAPVSLILPAASNRTVLYAITAGVAVAIVSALGFAAFVSSRRQKQEADPVFRARRDLDVVRASLAQATTRAGASVACEQLFRAFATYLSAALGIPADTQPHATIASFIATSHRLTADQRNELNALLADLERARFAPDAASVPLVQSLLDRVSSFINQTSPQEVHA